MRSCVVRVPLYIYQQRCLCMRAVCMYVCMYERAFMYTTYRLSRVEQYPGPAVYVYEQQPYICPCMHGCPCQKVEFSRQVDNGVVSLQACRLRLDPSHVVAHRWEASKVGLPIHITSNSSMQLVETAVRPQGGLVGTVESAVQIVG